SRSRRRRKRRCRSACRSVTVRFPSQKRKRRRPFLRSRFRLGGSSFMGENAMNPVETNGASNKVSGFLPSPAESQLLQSSLLAMAKGQGDGAASGPPGLSTTPTLTGLVQAIKRRWALALSVAGLITAATVAGVFFFHPPKYLVMLELRIVSRQAGPDDSEFPIFKASMETMVKNSIVLSDALNVKISNGHVVK